MERMQRMDDSRADRVDKMPILDILVIVSLRLRLSQISADFNLRNASR